MAGCVDVVDAEYGKAAVEGIAPSTPDLGEGVIEIGDELAVNDISGSRVEIASQNGWCGGVGAGLFESLQNAREFFPAKIPIQSVIRSALLAPQAHVRSGGGEMDIHELDFASVRKAQGCLMSPRGLVENFPADLETSHDSVGDETTVVSFISVEGSCDMLDQMGIDLLKDHDIRIPFFNVFNGIPIMKRSAVYCDDADRLTSVGCRFSFEGNFRVTQISESVRFICEHEQGDNPKSRDDQGWFGAEEAGGEARDQHAYPSPKPKRKHSECGK